MDYLLGYQLVTGKSFAMVRTISCHVISEGFLQAFQVSEPAAVRINAGPAKSRTLSASEAYSARCVEKRNRGIHQWNLSGCQERLSSGRLLARG